jgi:hypothetical protein
MADFFWFTDAEEEDAGQAPKVYRISQGAAYDLHCCILQNRLRT